MEKDLFKVKVLKEGRVYYDLYLAWFYKRVYYERVSPTFNGFSWKVLMASAIEVQSVEEMKQLVLSNVK